MCMNSLFYSPVVKVVALSIYLCCCALQVIERLIDSGDGDQIFQKAIQEQGRGQVCYVFFKLLLEFNPIIGNSFYNN